MAKQGLNEVWKGDKSPIAQLTEDLRISRSELDLYTVSIEKTKEALQGITNEAKKAKANKDSGAGLSGLQATNEEHKKAIALLEKEKAARESLRTLNDKLSVTKKQQIAAETALNKQRERALAQIAKESSAYNKLKATLSRLKLEYLELGAQNQQNTTRGKELLVQITALDKKYKDLNRSVGNNQVFVGEYEKGLGRLKNSFRSLIGLAGQFGLTLGFAAMGRSLADTEIKLKAQRLALANVLSSQHDYEKSLRYLSELSKSYGQDLLVLTDTYKNFIASSESSNLSLFERNKIYESIIKAGSSLALSNEQIEGSLLAVSQMFSKGTVSAEELRGQLGERIPGAFGLFAKAAGVSEAELGKMLQKGEILAKDILPKFAIELENAYGEKATQNLKTISGAWNVAQTQISEYISKANTAGGYTERLAAAISFLGKNIGGIITGISLVGKAFLIYKTRVIALNIANKLFGDGTEQNNRSLKNLGSNLKNATSASSGLGSALKGIGWTALIGLITEVAQRFYDIASGAALARQRTDEFAKAVDRGNKSGDKISGGLLESLKKQLQTIDLLNVSEKERLRLKKEAYSFTQAELKLKINEASLLYKTLESSRQQAKLDRDKFVRENGMFNINTQAQLQVEYQLKESVVTAVTARQKEARTVIENLRGEYSNLSDTLHDLSVEQKTTISNTDIESKKVKEKTKNYKDANDQIQRMVSLLAELQQIQDDVSVSESEIRLNQAIQTEIDSIIETGQYSLELINKIILAQYELEKAIIDRQATEEIDLAKNEDEVIKAGEKRGIKLLELEDRIAQKKKDINEKVNDALGNREQKWIDQQKNGANEVAENDKKLHDEELARQKEIADLRKKTVEELIQMQIEKSKAVETAIGKEIDANKKAQDQLQEQANLGVDTAKQSLAELQKIEIEKTKAQAKEAKKQESLERIKVAYQLFEQFISKGDNVATAGGKTLSGMSVLTALINGFKKFFHGTDDTGKTGGMKDQYGNITGVTHENEQVWSVADRKAVGFKSRKEIKEAVKLAESGGLNPVFYNASVRKDSFSMAEKVQEKENFKPVLSALDKVYRAIAEKPDQTFSVEMVDGIGKAVVATMKKGNDKLTKIYS